MESVLHIERIEREMESPATVGDVAFLYYGESENEDEDDLYAAEMRMGHPLWTDPDLNQTKSLSMVKTFGVSPCFNRGEDPLLTETTHVMEGGHLIPIRSKVHLGPNHVERYVHLPGLHHARSLVMGRSCEAFPQNPMIDVMGDLIEVDKTFKRRKKYPVMEWLQNDLGPLLDGSPCSVLAFESDPIHDTVGRFTDAVLSTPYDLQRHHMRNIAETVLPSPVSVPLDMFVPDVVSRSIGTIRCGAMTGGEDLKSHGKILLDHFDRIARNPSGFSGIVDFFDRLPLTDLNLDVVLDAAWNIRLFHVNIAVNRMSWYSKHYPDRGEGVELIEEVLTSSILRKIIKTISVAHPKLPQEIGHRLIHTGIKLKIIKNSTDELAILLYPPQSNEHADPICGVYFDISMLSLAPVSIIPRWTYF